MRNEALDALLSPYREELLDNPVRPLNVPQARPAKARRGKLITAMLYGDTHYPHQCDATLKVVQAIAKDAQPDLLVHMGDLVDSADLSIKFKKNPARKETLQDEINMASVHLAQMRNLCPDSRMVLLEGNHEERMTRVLWDMEGPAKSLTQLTDVQRALTWPKLLRLDQLACEFVPYKEQAKHSFLPKFILKHGTVVRQKSGYTANAEHAKYGKSGASGHTHRLAQFMHRDHNGNHIWLETGCTCSLNPEYTPDPDWQNGCVLLTMHQDTGAFQAESIYIHNGNAVVRGQMYRA